MLDNGAEVFVAYDLESLKAWILEKKLDIDTGLLFEIKKPSFTYYPNFYLNNVGSSLFGTDNEVEVIIKNLTLWEWWYKVMPKLGYDDTVPQQIVFDS